MDATCFIHIKSEKFPVLPGEDDELINEGTYGKALSQFLESHLKQRSYDVPFFCCEDWGWWIEITGQPFKLGVCVYGTTSTPENHEHCVMVSESPGRRWSWRKFGFVDTAPRVNKLFGDLREILASDGDIEILGYPEGYPLD